MALLIVIIVKCCFRCKCVRRRESDAASDSDAAEVPGLPIVVEEKIEEGVPIDEAPMELQAIEV